MCVCVCEQSSMQQIYRQSDQQFEVYTTVFSPQGGSTHTCTHTINQLPVIMYVLIKWSVVSWIWTTNPAVSVCVSVQVEDEDETCGGAEGKDRVHQELTVNDPNTKRPEPPNPLNYLLLKTKNLWISRLFEYCCLLHRYVLLGLVPSWLCDVQCCVCVVSSICILYYFIRNYRCKLAALL